MKPLYAACLGDLRPGDLVLVECACGHSIATTAELAAGRLAAVARYQNRRSCAEAAVPGVRRAGKGDGEGRAD